MSNLFWAEAFPVTAVELLVQGKHEERICHIDERGAHIAVVRYVDGQVEEVVAATVVDVYLFE